jgi:Na+-transporting methylmalonyl-CoA/oxaloacetate decarboxylase gamma subunit
MLLDGIMITAVGMLVVFAFLLVLVLSMRLLEFATRRSRALSGGVENPEILIAIARAAIAARSNARDDT